MVANGGVAAPPSDFPHSAVKHDIFGYVRTLAQTIERKRMFLNQIEIGQF